MLWAGDECLSGGGGVGVWAGGVKSNGLGLRSASTPEPQDCCLREWW